MVFSFQHIFQNIYNNRFEVSKIGRIKASIRAYSDGNACKLFGLGKWEYYSRYLGNRFKNRTTLHRIL